MDIRDFYQTDFEKFIHPATFWVKSDEVVAWVPLKKQGILAVPVNELYCCNTKSLQHVAWCPMPVSYTHLDVYKRQHVRRRGALWYESVRCLSVGISYGEVQWSRSDESIGTKPGGSCTHEIKNKGVVGTSSSPVLLGVCRWDFFCYWQQNSHRGGIVAGHYWVTKFIPL